ncbi:type IX secretion system periplasmic lipoprotein PorW/SprE [Flavobacterium sp. U410]
MKNNKLSTYFFAFGTLFLIIACSVKKDKFINRNFHAVTTEYNVLYNGNLALDVGLEELKVTYQDNYWEVLPIERTVNKEQNTLPGQSKNTNFDRAEEKATKAIQKHSMNIGGTEKNPQMDEAYILLGKARYYENRYLPALEAFNYILYKYPKSDRIYHAKVWREKVNIRLNSEELAIKNLKKLLGDQKIEGQDLADANAMLSQAYINLEALDSAVTTLRVAKLETKNKEEKARYTFILGQLYDKVGYPDSAFAAYQEVIDMKRKSPRRYVIHAHAEQAKQFDYKNGDTIAFLEKYKKLLEDRENRPYLDVLNHQMGIFYDNFQKDSLAKVYYNRSLKTLSQDRYLSASNYRNIAEIYFRSAKYKTAGMYYDSTLTRLDERTREFRKIKKKRDNLSDVIHYEEIAVKNDSILHIVAMSESARTTYFQNYIDKLKIQDELKAKLAKEQAKKEENIRANGGQLPENQSKSGLNGKQGSVSMSPPGGASMGGQQSTFYFYNQSTVAYGRTEFQKKWGKIALKDNWRLSASKDKGNIKQGEEEEEVVENESNKEEVVENPLYKVEYYLEQVPADTKLIDSLSKERNAAYYQLGIIYKEKFKEYELAANRLETLLKNNPEERLILPAKYNLYKIYEIIDPKKALVYKNDILNEYPESRYAEIIRNPTEAITDNDNPDAVYKGLYKQVEEGKLREVYPVLLQKVDDYIGDEALPKFEMLKAIVSGRLLGLEEYKKGLNYVALTYPNTEEGKEAELLMQKNIPRLEQLDFSQKESSSWKIVFPKKYPAEASQEKLLATLKKYLDNTKNSDLKLSVDIYDMENDFVILHGLKSKDIAKSVLSLLKDYKDYKLKDEMYCISSDDYTVIQVKKNFPLWLQSNKE